MSLPTLSGVARLTDDPALRFAPSGTAVCKVRLAFNSRKRDDAGNWSDGDSFYVDGVLFKQAAEHAAESLSRGTEVVVTGRLKTEQWEDKNGGGKRSAPSLLIDSIGPSLAFATAKVEKMQRSGAQSSGKGGGSGFGGGNDDPWANSAPAGGKQSSFDDEPPF
ncbi:single-stranded DNA-binding protein [Dactylosporangium sp. NPDC000244]|uniref:single-stranded DNA-binding protein n=1 Tax=Dactylosporangium sp. NPDC000244 TaxID=3154365 RepID=UPI00333085D5